LGGPPLGDAGPGAQSPPAPPGWGPAHTREYGMLLWAGPGVGGELGTRESFADLGATWARLFGLAWEGPGKSLV
jgi:phosphopentomutase